MEYPMQQLSALLKSGAQVLVLSLLVAVRPAHAQDLAASEEHEEGASEPGTARADLIESIESLADRPFAPKGLGTDDPRSLEPEIYALQQGYSLESGELSLSEAAGKGRKRRIAAGAAILGTSALYYAAAVGVAESTPIHLNLAGAVGLLGGLRLFSPTYEERTQRRYLEAHPDRLRPAAEMAESDVPASVTPTDSAQIYREWLEHTQPGMVSKKREVILWKDYLEKYPQTAFRERIGERIETADLASISLDMSNTWPPREDVSVFLADEPMVLVCPVQDRTISARKSSVGKYALWVHSEDAVSCFVYLDSTQERPKELRLPVVVGEPGFWYCEVDGRDGCVQRDTVIVGKRASSTRSSPSNSKLDRQFLQGQEVSKGASKAYGYSWGVVLLGIPALGIDLDLGLGVMVVGLAGAGVSTVVGGMGLSQSSQALQKMGADYSPARTGLYWALVAGQFIPLPSMAVAIPATPITLYSQRIAQREAYDAYNGL
jgi:hypothetical protein